MLHSIDATKHGPLGHAMARAVETCVHCGFCLAACPTYHHLGQEMDSPRGRIVLMKSALEGGLSWTAAQPHIDRCLGCLACEPACPSGVSYRELINPFRATAAPHFRRRVHERLGRALLGMTLPFPRRLRWALALARAGRALGPALPRTLRAMIDLAPTQSPPRQSWPNIIPAQGERRARVALLIGCAQQVLEPDINTATIEVLSRNGVEVHVPPRQVCCGGLAWHSGNWSAARTFARGNLAAFPDNLDAIVTNAAGCGSTMQEYHLILRGTADEARADQFRKRVMDVSVFLAKIGLRAPAGFGSPRRIAYHDACHLANAQNVKREPRNLLLAIPGVQVNEIADAHLCCGSAGSYNLEQPVIARELGEQKAKSVLAANADVVATGNIGCLIQLRAGLARLGSSLPVRHTMQLLRDAYRR